MDVFQVCGQNCVVVDFVISGVRFPELTRNLLCLVLFGSAAFVWTGFREVALAGF